MEQATPRFVEVRTPLPRNPVQPLSPPISWEPYRRSTRWRGLKQAPQFLCLGAFAALLCAIALPIAH